MSKSRVCIEKTASLAKHGLTKSQKILVHEPLPKECIPPAYKPTVSRPQPKRIKVCTGVEMRKICPPKITPVCPPKPLTFGQKLTRLAMFGMKGLVAAGLIYVTTDLGVWGDSKTSRELYETIMCDIADLFDKGTDKKEQIPSSCQEYFHAAFGEKSCEDLLIESREKRMSDLKQKWNNVVMIISRRVAKLITGEVDEIPHTVCETEEEPPKKK